MQSSEFISRTHSLQTQVYTVDLQITDAYISWNQAI